MDKMKWMTKEEAVREHFNLLPYKFIEVLIKTKHFKAFCKFIRENTIPCNNMACVEQWNQARTEIILMPIKEFYTLQRMPYWGHIFINSPSVDNTDPEYQNLEHFGWTWHAAVVFTTINILDKHSHA
jgi:hypothetical protein